jgi:hypothetical protein
MKGNWILLFCLFCCLSKINSQSLTPFAITSQGSSTVNGDAMLDWSIGEAVILTHYIEEAILTQGFHQPEVQIISSSVSENNFDVQVYPNPSIDKVFINSSGNINWTLFNLSGQILETNTTMAVQLNLYPVGMYLLNIQQGDYQKYFQIIKH